MKSAYQDLFINQGSTHDFELIIYEDDAQTQAADLTGFSVRGQVRKSYSSSNAAATFTTSIGPITTLDGRDQNGKNAISFALSSTQTALLIEHDYVYDIELFSVDSNDTETVYRILEGKIYVNPEVTR